MSSSKIDKKIKENYICFLCYKKCSQSCDNCGNIVCDVCGMQKTLCKELNCPECYLQKDTLCEDIKFPHVHGWSTYDENDKEDTCTCIGCQKYGLTCSLAYIDKCMISTIIKELKDKKKPLKYFDVCSGNYVGKVVFQGLNKNENQRIWNSGIQKEFDKHMSQYNKPKIHHKKNKNKEENYSLK